MNGQRTWYKAPPIGEPAAYPSPATTSVRPCNDACMEVPDLCKMTLVLRNYTRSCACIIHACTRAIIISTPKVNITEFHAFPPAVGYLPSPDRSVH